MKEYFNFEIPENFRVYEKEFGIEGIQDKKDNFMKVLKKDAVVAFTLRADPTNPNDPNAIAIFAKRKGFFGQVERPIGYLPKKISSHILKTELLSFLMIRPRKLYIGDDNYIGFSFDILGRKDTFKQYKNAS
ncbi:hypothetical protein [Leucothrix arctica]|uniref:HIRAN domain-containing protein n=1 Tax=Leucothrix arctica TaxID=1481894 RepID=A0A317CD18_9GAMM|nr:hypothetical protein [Leucothrix arctica]PWQ96001.1 hypothetical protein DKT75_11525 [Leucothrix arctica]